MDAKPREEQNGRAFRQGDEQRARPDRKRANVDCTLHLIDEKQYREIYVPAVAGDESALNQLLEWASLLSAGWESRSEAYRLVKELARQVEGRQNQARGIGDGGRTADFGKNLNYVYGVLSAFRRPAFYAKDFSFTTMNKIGLGDLSSFVVDARVLLEGYPNCPAWLPATTTGGLASGQDLGPLPSEGSRRAVPQGAPLAPGKKLRREDPRRRQEPRGGSRLAHRRVRRGEGDPPRVRDPRAPGRLLPRDRAHDVPRRVAARAFANNTFPSAVLKEVRKALGTLTPVDTAPPPPEPVAAPAPSPYANEPAVPYSPQRDFKVGQRVTHKRFGTGEVKKVLNSTKVVIAFGTEERTLAQNATTADTPSSPAVTTAEAVSAAEAAAATPPPRRRGARPARPHADLVRLADDDDASARKRRRASSDDPTTPRTP